MRVVPGCPLWLGHAGDVRNVRGLHAAGIAAVIDLALEEPPALLSRDLVYCRFPLIDGPGNSPWLVWGAVEVVVRLLRCGVPTLVACGAGMSRTPAIAGAALARVEGCPLEEGLARVVRCGAADVSPGLWNEVEAAVGSAEI